MTSEKGQEKAGESRRQFLKKAGAVAWVVPTMQVVNMAGASAGIDTSVVPTTSSTSTTTTTTTQAPDCQVFSYCRIKADWEGRWRWDSGVGNNDCIRDDQFDFLKCMPGDVGDGSTSISGDDRSASVTVPADCEITVAKHKADQGCFDASISNNGRTATFSAQPQDISHVELIVKCCAEER